MSVLTVFLCVAFLSLSTTSIQAQTVWSEDFSTNSNNDISGDDNNLPSGSDWSRSAPSNGYAKVTGGQFKIYNIDSEVTITFETIDISAYSTHGVDLSIDLIGDNNMDTGSDWIKFYYNVDGGGETLFTNNGDNDGKTNLTATETGLIGSNLIITVKLRCSHWRETPRIDNIIVTDAAPLVAENIAGSGYALDLTGDTDGYVGIPTPADMEFGSSQDFTIEFWGAVIQSNTWETFLADKDWSSYTNDGWIFSTYDDDLMGFNVSDGSDRVDLFSTINLDSDETWHHYAVSVDRDGNAIMYVDGILTDSESMAAIGNIDNSLDINIGRGSGNEYDGEIKIDEIRVWDDVRSQTEIRNNMCSKLEGDETNLIHYWRIDEGDGGTSTSIPDVTGTATGTLYNLTPSSDWIWSGASLGDESVYEATVTTSTSDLNIAHTNGDDLTIEFTSGTAASYCVYRVDEAPIVNTPPGTQTSISTTTYYGARGFNTSGFDYTATYNYDGHTGITDEDMLELSTKADNTVQAWTQESATLNTTANTLILTGETANEYILGFVPGDDIYSITNGDWGTSGTWSYTSGGASCSCIPDATSVVHVESPYTVNIVADVYCKDLTVYSGGILQWTSTYDPIYIYDGGSITVNSGGAIDKNGQAGSDIIFIDVGGDYNIVVNDATTGIDCSYMEIAESSTLAISGAGNITIADDFEFEEDDSKVTNDLTGTFIITGGIHTLAGGFDGDNKFTNNQTMTVGKIHFQNDRDTLDNKGTITVTGNIYNNAASNDDHVVINSGTLNINGNIDMNNGNMRVYNTGTINLTGDILDVPSTNGLYNQAGGVFNLAGTSTTDTDLNLYCNYDANTFNYSGAGNQTIIQPQDNYWHLTTSSSGTKYTSYSPVDINGDLTISGSAILDAGTGADDITIGGNWSNSTLSGFIEGSQTVTFDGGTTQTLLNSSGTETFNNLVLSTASTVLQLDCDIDVNGNITIANNTDLDAATSSKNINIAGNWVNNDTDAIDGFSPGIGTVTFDGGGPQTIDHAGGTEAFNNLTLLTASTKVQLNDHIDLSGNVTIADDTELDANTSTKNITLAGNWINNEGTASGGFLEGLGSVTFDGTGAQAITHAGSMETFYDLTLQGSGTITPAHSLDIDNDITIGGTTTFDVNTNTADLTIAGNWINSGGAFTEGTRTVTFNGGGAQSITHGTSETFYNLIVSNIADEITLNDPTIITGALTLTNGNIITTSTNLLTLNDAATTSIGSDDSFVDGPMKKIGNEAIDFPVGDAGKWRRIGITAPAFSTTEFTAEYFDAGHSDATTLDAGIANVSINSYWDLSQGVNDDDVSIELFWEDAAAEGIDDCADITIGHYYDSGSGTKWHNEAGTKVGGSDCSGATSGSVKSNETVTEYSPFSFGSLSPSLNALPIELISFNATINGDQVDLEWETASEINNDYFTIQRSTDAINFDDISNVGGAGNSNSNLHYSIIDFSPLENVSYYRLKQTDYDGKYEYSQVIYVNFEFELISNPGVPVILVSPNPINRAGTINVLLSNFAENEIVNVVLYKHNGTACSNNILNTDSEGNVTFTMSCVDFDPGLYVISAKSNSREVNSRIVIAE